MKTMPLIAIGLTPIAFGVFFPAAAIKKCDCFLFSQHETVTRMTLAGKNREVPQKVSWVGAVLVLGGEAQQLVGRFPQLPRRKLGMFRREQQLVV